MMASESTEKSLPPRGDAIRQIACWVLQIIPAVIFGRAAFYKLTGAAGSRALFASLEMEPTGRVLIGVLELSCAIFLLIPSLSSYGAILGLGIMIGAAIGHVTVIGFGGAFLTLFLSGNLAAVCCLALIYLRREEVPVVRSMFER